MPARNLVSITILLACFVTAAVGENAAVPCAPEPLSVQSGQVQLFVDDYLIAEQAGLRRTVHQPRKDHGGRRPIIAARPGSTVMALGTIVFDPKLERYVAFMRDHRTSTYYRATSADGLTWDASRQEELTEIHFPMDLEPGPDARGNQGLDLFSCCYNSRDKTHPYQGWLYYANFGHDREGIYFMKSPDGLTWERGPLVVNAWAGPGDASSRTIHQDGKTVYGPGDVTIFYQDPRSDRYLGIFKFFTTEDVGEGNNLRSRAYMFLDSIDMPVDTGRIARVALLPPAADRDGNTKFDEYYASTAWRYESLWLGGLKVYHFRGDYPYSAAGCAFLKLAVSRDGLNWQKVSFHNDDGLPEVFIPNGPEGGNEAQNDGGYMAEFSQGPLKIGDELIYYYSSSSYGKNHDREVRLTGGGIFRARLRVDGFVSVDGGTLTTKPLKCSGKDLTINAAGPLRVELIAADGKVHACSIQGDSLQHPATFEGESLGDLADGRPVQLRFTVRPGSRLYSFTIR